MADTNILYDEQGHPRHFTLVEDATRRKPRRARTLHGPHRRRKPPKSFWQATPTFCN
jgi:hypothetical protein